MKAFVAAALVVGSSATDSWAIAATGCPEASACAGPYPSFEQVKSECLEKLTTGCTAQVTAATLDIQPATICDDSTTEGVSLSLLPESLNNLSSFTINTFTPNVKYTASPQNCNVSARQVHGVPDVAFDGVTCDLGSKLALGPASTVTAVSQQLLYTKEATGVPLDATYKALLLNSGNGHADCAISQHSSTATITLTGTIDESLIGDEPVTTADETVTTSTTGSVAWISVTAASFLTILGTSF